ncbi:hypothetical protein Cylst_3089 [Cylindrospermum stagnale PCC 7417]|uniref:Uncharacterized protein n=1 Tax=Cylindrospermum stagnale PCC 7417 TaxID=56107 RepID=K9WZL7_9NOST|nr:hypothetical protein Cylst_3089 [Cylindrospermum stagnale PCC 7417]
MLVSLPRKPGTPPLAPPRKRGGEFKGTFDGVGHDVTEK